MANRIVSPQTRAAVRSDGGIADPLTEKWCGEERCRIDCLRLGSQRCGCARGEHASIHDKSTTHVPARQGGFKRALFRPSFPLTTRTGLCRSTSREHNQLRNGPCGGVRPGGYCEVYSERRCVWTQAWERSLKMRIYADPERRCV
ncbi:MAG: hypothetical protein GX597_27655 [Anaerolineaceae bacterium]|nr:hypothetical protein [Anaerolineaceae bacterium]